MQPKNKQERTRAFINFVLLFILCIAIIVTTVFFSVDVPVKQARDLRQQIHNYEKERISSSQFITKMSEIGALLDTINTMRDPDPTDLQIKLKLDDLQTKVSSDSVYDQILYQNVLHNLYELRKTKQQLRQVTSSDDKVKELQRDNAALQQKLDARTTEYNNLLLQSTQRK